ncbi:hypothetical protein PC116_g27414 [Phytophthora cactorum]|nr:hypothetical protein PC116_g27414 [Phytophthora cactorum]
MLLVSLHAALRRSSISNLTGCRQPSPHTTLLAYGRHAGRPSRRYCSPTAITLVVHLDDNARQCHAGRRRSACWLSIPKPPLTDGLVADRPHPNATHRRSRCWLSLSKALGSITSHRNMCSYSTACHAADRLVGS